VSLANGHFGGSRWAKKKASGKPEALKIGRYRITFTGEPPSRREREDAWSREQFILSRLISAEKETDFLILSSREIVIPFSLLFQ
jgi:hypothetical protein